MQYFIRVNFTSDGISLMRDFDKTAPNPEAAFDLVWQLILQQHANVVHLSHIVKAKSTPE